MAMDDRKKFAGGCIIMVAGAVYLLCMLTACDALFRRHWGWGGFWSFVACTALLCGCELPFAPLVISILAMCGAVWGWGWPWWAAVLAFGLPDLLYVTFMIADMAAKDDRF